MQDSAEGQALAEPQRQRIVVGVIALGRGRSAPPAEGQQALAPEHFQAPEIVEGLEQDRIERRLQHDFRRSACAVGQDFVGVKHLRIRVRRERVGDALGSEARQRSREVQARDEARPGSAQRLVEPLGAVWKVSCADDELGRPAFRPSGDELRGFSRDRSRRRQGRRATDRSGSPSLRQA